MTGSTGDGTGKFITKKALPYEAENFPIGFALGDVNGDGINDSLFQTMTATEFIVATSQGVAIAS